VGNQATSIAFENFYEEDARMTVHNRVFASSSKSWEALCDEASAFASEVGPEKLINRLILFNFVHLGLVSLPMLTARSRSPSATSLCSLAAAGAPS
jgi:hypothetical protein